MGKVAEKFNGQEHNWYSYDEQGRMIWNVKNTVGVGIVTIEYEYKYPIGDIVSKVIYQKGKNDEFVHIYSYDADHRLVQVCTESPHQTQIDAEGNEQREKITEAVYKYYDHGPLKRKALGKDDNEKPLQGMDYTYTVQGQLKTINHPVLDFAYDPGHDFYNPDVFGMKLNYFPGDYHRGGTEIDGSGPMGTSGYNGRIAGWMWNGINFNDEEPFDGFNPYTFRGYKYLYDQRNWMEEAQHYKLYGLNFSPLSGPVEEYTVDNIEYDPNGNLLQLDRNAYDVFDGGANIQYAKEIDRLSYTYKDPIEGKTNRLLRVGDSKGVVLPAKDIGSLSFEYDNAGQLTKKSDGFKEYLVDYYANGLVKKLTTEKGNSPDFFYNADGKRVAKGGTYYVRDDSGNILSIYQNDQNGNLKQTEIPIYGSGRLGIIYRGSNTDDNSVSLQRTYEITDHLGNVRAVIGLSSNPQPCKTYSLLNASDYYPFGWPMPGRTFSSGQNYRFAYQGQEKDPKTGEEAFELRSWDGRLGRWMSIDPYKVHASPYLGMGNNPVSLIDPDGGTPDYYFDKNNNLVGVEGTGPDRYFFEDAKGNVQKSFDGVSYKFTENPSPSFRIVQIFIDPGNLPNDVGHSAIGIGNNTWGAYPTDLNNDDAYGKDDLKNSPLIIHTENLSIFKSDYPHSKTYYAKVSIMEQFYVMQYLVTPSNFSGRNYKLFSCNCTTIAQEVV